jgi:hypothetical protein
MMLGVGGGRKFLKKVNNSTDSIRNDRMTKLLDAPVLFLATTTEQLLLSSPMHQMANTQEMAA